MIIIQKYIVTGLVAAFILLAVTTGFAGEGEGEFKIGYTFIDEEGSLNINQESYNLYEGLGLSFNNFRYITNNGLNFNADLNNVTLNNRNLRFSTSKSRLFRLSVNHNKYRRLYNPDGSDFTRRHSTGIQANIMPSKNLKFFGGFNQTNKKGDNFNILSPVADTVIYSTDYSHKSFNFGGQGFCPYGNLRIEYRSFDFSDELDATNDRESNTINVSAFSRIPKYRWITLSGGYHYRLDKIDANNLELKTNQLWGSTKIYFRSNNTLEYRILFARSKHDGNLTETDNYIHTVAFGKTWLRQGGIRIGYENRIADDLTDHTSSNGFLFSGWYKMKNRLHFKGKASIRNKEVKTGATLVGDEDYTRYLFSVKYSDKQWGDLTGRYDGRIRKNDDINSKVDYTSLSSVLNLRQNEYGRLTVTYSYYLGKYENNSDNVSYEFSDHVISGSIHPVSYHNLTVSVGGTYYRSQRIQDIEKFNLSFTGIYSFPHDHDLEVRYNVFNYDDYLLRGNYYTGNIVEVNFIKHLSL